MKLYPQILLRFLSLRIVGLLHPIHFSSHLQSFRMNKALFYCITEQTGPEDLWEHLLTLSYPMVPVKLMDEQFALHWPKQSQVLEQKKIS